MLNKQKYNKTSFNNSNNSYYGRPSCFDITLQSVAILNGIEGEDVFIKANKTNGGG